MKSYKLNLEKTYEIFEKSKDNLKLGYCYNNCINVLCKVYTNSFIFREYKIAYCYVGGRKHYMQRHCVVINDKDEIIDFTVPLMYESIEEARKVASNIDYYIFKVLNSDEYRDLVKITNEPDFKGMFQEEELNAYINLSSKGLEFNKDEFSYYIRPLIEKKEK